MDFFKSNFSILVLLIVRRETKLTSMESLLRSEVAGGYWAAGHALFVSLPAVDIPAFEKGPSHYFSFLKES